ncbi:DEAD/DEAH box helicase [Pseudonocardia sp. ICBG1034]|uniref:DEAD/DEAH box helicase n=1 Tax=Pseudonocardia sp. ICBG1034 TaxID=2844381 RepID=UPI001CCCF076|nr:DEAD/DEAH box helicase [Pseudonocardia sp. ICBG1034]
MADEQAADVVEFWRSVELFTFQRVPRAARVGPGQPPTAFDIAGPGPLPWQEGHEAARRDAGPDREWRYVVHAGLFDAVRVQREIVRVFGEDRAGPERRSGQGALFAFAIGADGYLVENSAALSSCAWAVGRLRAPGPRARNWLDGFEQEGEAFAAALNRLSAPSPAASDAPSSPDPHGSEEASGARRVARAVGRHVSGAATDALNEGARTLGGLVTGAASVAITGVAGPLVGGYAGSAAGTFAEKLLTITRPDGNGTHAGPTPQESRPPRPPATTMTAGYLATFVAELARLLHIDRSLEPTGIRVVLQSVPTSRRYDDDTSPMLNSFIGADLSRIAAALRSGDAGDALRRYLTPDRGIDLGRRIDTFVDGASVLAHVEPSMRPPGRWPVGRQNPLAIGQQLAVNRIVGELADGTGVTTVNGPPGTGKTTLLRDVVAAVVVRRAETLSALPSLDAAFVGEVSYVDNGVRRRVPTLRPDLTGWEVVLATNSNAAAENVTHELPSAPEDEIDRLRTVGHFPDLASRFLDKPAWALVAAALGNRKNRRRFADIVWWPGDTEQVPGIRVRLRAAADDPTSCEGEWAAAVEAYQQVRDRVERLTSHRQTAADALRRHTGHPERRRALAADALQAEAISVAADRRQEQSVREQNACELRNAQVDSEIASHLLEEPGWWARSWTLGAAHRSWRRRHAELLRRRVETLTSVNAAALQLEHVRREADLARAELVAVQQALQAADQVADQDAVIVAEARSRWPQHVPAGDPDDPGFQRHAPWADAEIEAARADLFESALRLHRAFILATARRIRPALIAANKIIGGDLSPDRPVARAAWQAFFVMVPVVSTTFASLPRLFEHLGREDLGWLLVDEAGQATAQSVVGGLWRAQRAVLVGDPMQLEPIVPLPVPAQTALANRHGVDHQWLPERRSAQLAADRLNRFGTTVGSPDGEEIWVGAPLRVHRRCDRPMFDIANTVAYASSPMVFATPVREPRPWRPSQWIDVRGPVTDNVVRPEIERLAALVAELTAGGCTREEILVIAPFRTVVGAVRKRLSGLLEDDRMGTVHTVQGKESPVVILVLGGSAGARAWVAEKPNLLNVAVSRAQERFYVIGDRADWGRRRFFSSAAEWLPVSSDG